MTNVKLKAYHCVHTLYSTKMSYKKLAIRVWVAETNVTIILYLFQKVA